GSRNVPIRTGLRSIIVGRHALATLPALGPSGRLASIPSRSFDIWRTVDRCRGHLSAFAAELRLEDGRVIGRRRSRLPAVVPAHPREVPAHALGPGRGG